MNLTYNPALGVATRREARLDWPMSRAVDRAIHMLAERADHDEVAQFLRGRMVPLHVSRRVLAGHGVRRGV